MRSGENLEVFAHLRQHLVVSGKIAETQRGEFRLTLGFVPNLPPPKRMRQHIAVLKRVDSDTICTAWNFGRTEWG